MPEDTNKPNDDFMSDDANLGLNDLSFNEEETEKNLDDSVYQENDDLFNKKIRAVPKPKIDIDIDVDQSIIDNIITAGEKSSLDITQLESFTNLTHNRNQIYELIDSMANDPIIAAALETYAEDATETNTEGVIVWSESENADINAYITYLLNSINVDKNIYKWVYSLCKYGDCYLKLFRNSEFNDALFDDEENDRKTLNESLREELEHLTDIEPKNLNEDVIVKTYSKNDRFVHYLEMVPNPGEMYELTRFGKSYAYVQADAPINSTVNDDLIYNAGTFKYNFKKRDVKLHSAVDFVHAALEDNISRTPEQVNIFRTDEDYETDTNALSYTVRRGQSLLYNTFKIWRELMLLENSLLLNRLTKSSILRVINVEVGDMPKENVNPHLAGIKHLIEQKSALSVGNSMTEYVNPGPMENNIYIPQRNGQGAINMQSIGGDVDVKGLADLDYFKNKLYGALRIPKQFLGDTDDATGFNGGTSLSIVSSRYAKAIKRIQNTILQALTDALNLILIDRGLSSYVNKFTLHMVPPTTQEEVDRMSNMQNEISIYSDILSLLAEIENPSARLRIAKILLSNVVSKAEVLDIVEKEIEKLEEITPNEPNETDPLMPGGTLGGTDFDLDGGDNLDSLDDFEDSDSVSDSGDLPSPSDLGVDMTTM